jgi:hypothetical protein
VGHESSITASVEEVEGLGTIIMDEFDEAAKWIGIYN